MDLAAPLNGGREEVFVRGGVKLTPELKAYAEGSRSEDRSTGGGGAYSFLGSPAGLDISSVALGIRHNF